VRERRGIVTFVALAPTFFIKCSYSGYVRLGIRAWACGCACALRGAGSWDFHRKVDIAMRNKKLTRHTSVRV